MSLTGVISSLSSSVLGTIPWLFLTAICLALILWYNSRPAGIPPGPLGIPILGFIPFLTKNTPKLFQELAKKYGPVFSVWMGSQLTVVLNDYQSIRSAFVDQGDAFSGRMITSSTQHAVPLQRKGITTGDGAHWRENRRFALSTFRNYGVGRSSFESAILNEISYFVGELEKLKNRNVDLSDLLGLSVCNNVVILTLGKRMEYSDPEFHKLKHAMDDLVACSGRNTFAGFFVPWIRHIPGSGRFLGSENFRAAFFNFFHLLQTQINFRRKEYKSGDSDDYVSAFLTEQERRNKLKDPGDYFDDETLLANMRVMFNAGTETTANTLRWGLLYLVAHPDVQRKVQKEIDEVVGAQRMPSVDDRSRMPYTEAVLLEIQRMGSVLPLAISHRVTEDVELNGYRIPKDTLVYPNIYAVHRDEKLCPDSNSFRPERFIDSSGKVVKPDWLIPFSVGKRFCPGESLARMELFLYFVTMFQKFTFAAPEGATLDLEPLVTVARIAKPFKTRITLRNM